MAAAAGTTQIKDSEPGWHRPEDDVYDLLDQGRFLQQGRGRDNESNEEVRMLGSCFESNHTCVNSANFV